MMVIIIVKILKDIKIQQVINLNKKMIMIVNKVMENLVVYQTYQLLIINQIKVIGLYLIIITIGN